jgi:magnesium-transporting ATPase (P-type)
MAKYSKSYSRGKVTYSNKQKEDASGLGMAILGGIVLALVAILTIGLIIIFMPAIIITSIINYCYFNINSILLAPNYLWGTTLTISLIIIAILLYKLRHDFWKTYAIFAIVCFIIGGLYCLFFPNSILITTVIQMYPYLKLWIL